MKKIQTKIRCIYNMLQKAYGPMNWWPADSAFEVIIGAILTQNTSWANVEKSIALLKKEKKLSPAQLYKIKKRKLSTLIKSSGYYNIKAQRIKNFIDFLFKNYQGKLNKLFSGSTNIIREKLLSVKGIGPETADSILLYAGDKPVFVVDAYTKRLFARQGLLKADATYEETQQLFHKMLPKSSKLFNEYHALIVQHAKVSCKKKPICLNCVLFKMCKFIKKNT